MLTFKQYLDKVNAAIGNIHYPQEPQRLYQPIAYTMALGGKRLRPVLTLMACEAMGGQLEAAMDAALAIEMFHNFTLLHDDVMDRADVRRGRPTVHRRWNDNVAILSGDAMLTMASSLAAKTGNAAVLELFNRTAMEIYEGQQWDMDFETRDDVTVNEYMNMIWLKTSVLLGCACKVGAIVAGAREVDAANLYTMGANMGIAFQLQDDRLDVWGDEKTFGKEIGGDITQNKKTFLLISALNNARGTQAEELRHWLSVGADRRAEKVAAVTAIYEQLGLDKEVERMIAYYSGKAIDALDRVCVSMPLEACDAFSTLIHSLTNRDR